MVSKVDGLQLTIFKCQQSLTNRTLLGGGVVLNHILLNFSGSNPFGNMKICWRQG